MTGYTLVREIGKGGMGNIYEGTDPDGQRVAIKMMSCKITGNPEFRELFYSEAAALKKMHHPNVVNIVGNPFSDEQGNLYLPMEFVDGETIEHYVHIHGVYSEFDAIGLLSKILDVFAYIHHMGCIHRDIKPSNIMIRPDGSICVIDFGIAKDMKTSTGKTIGRIIGTDGYMSPEQANGNSVDFRTDIYSLGCLLHYLLTGKHAIVKKSNEYETICSILQDQFPLARDLNPQISEHIQKVILKAVDKNMLRRYQTAMDFKAALNPVFHPQESDTKDIPGKIGITVGRKGCDLIIPGEYISGCHLEIEYKEEFSSGSTIEYLLLSDKSTNGTSVNGKYLHHNNIRIPFSFQQQPDLPDVFLAGREEYLLNWTEVIRRLKEKLGTTETDHIEVLPPLPTPPLQQVKLNIGYGILSFLFPIVGWVLWGVWKKTTPGRARKAAILAWCGFVLGMILNLVIQN